MAKQKTFEQLEEAIIKALGSEVLETLRGLDLQEFKERLATLALHEQETTEHQANNEALNAAAEEVKALRAPYKETLKGLTLQRQYIAACLEKMGKPVEHGTNGTANVVAIR